MKQLRTLLFMILSYLSMAMALSIGGLWIRRYWVSEGLKWGDMHDLVRFHTGKGRLEFLHLTKDYLDSDTERMIKPGFEYLKTRLVPAGRMVNLGQVPPDCIKINVVGYGFEIHHWVAFSQGPPAYHYDHWVIGIQFGWVLATFLISPALWVAGWRLRRVRYCRLKGGLCLSCGYDLRNNPAAEHCPECGTAISSTSRMLAAHGNQPPSQ